MNETLAVSVLSRPKVHRLPVRPKRTHAKTAAIYSFLHHVMATRPAIFTSGAVVSMLVLAMLLKGFISMVSYHVAGSPPAANAELNGDFKKYASLGKNSLNTIVITGDDGTIIGQMAKLPSHNEQLTDINSISEVDKNTGRELLSIVSKY